MDNCPYCKAGNRKQFSPAHPIVSFGCGTRIVQITDNRNRVERSTRCYEAEITALKQRLVKAEELLRRCLRTVKSFLQHPK